MSEKAANVQRKTLKDLQKVQRTIDHGHFKGYKKSLATQKENIKKLDK